MDHIACSTFGDELNYKVCFFFEKSYITASGLNLIGFDWINALALFSMPLNTVFNTFPLSSVSEIENYFAYSHKMKFNDVFIENLSAVPKSKPPSSCFSCSKLHSKSKLLEQAIQPLFTRAISVKRQSLETI